VKKAELARLVPAIRDVLSESILAGGSTIRDYAQPNGELGYFAANWRVYGREGQPCLTPGCTGTIARITQGGRSSFWCPKCQH
jgi:formamidopyrimidine-DNA glycosylase